MNADMKANCIEKNKRKRAHSLLVSQIRLILGIMR